MFSNLFIDAVILSFQELEEILVNSTDPEELKHVWLQWREKSGKEMREDYIRFAGLINDMARANSE